MLVQTSAEGIPSFIPFMNRWVTFRLHTSRNCKCNGFLVNYRANSQVQENLEVPKYGRMSYMDMQVGAGVLHLWIAAQAQRD